jgi:multimeric flavodoxin WrbA
LVMTEKMKILGICGTHKKNKKQSCSWFLLEQALACARELGAETDAINFVDYNILPCQGCNICMTGETCPQLKKRQDETLKVVEKIRWADGIIFSYPVYGLHPPGVLCNFIGGRGKAFLAEDKAIKGEQLLGEATMFTGKIVGSIVNAGGFGMEPALNTFFPAFLHTKALQVACAGTSLGEYQINPILQQSGMGRKIEEADWAIEMARAVAKRVVGVHQSPALVIFKNMLGLGELHTGEASTAKAGQEVVWTAEAREQLGKIPFFVRKMAKQRIEEEARKKGLSEITIELMLEVKEKMGR